MAVTRSTNVSRQALKEASQPVGKDVHTPASKPPSTGGRARHRRRLWLFGAVVVSGFCSAPLMATLVAARGARQGAMAGLLLAGSWLALLFILLVLTLPRESR
jgi:hypothetical protein